MSGEPCSAWPQWSLHSKSAHSSSNHCVPVALEAASTQRPGWKEGRPGVRAACWASCAPSDILITAHAEHIRDPQPRAEGAHGHRKPFLPALCACTQHFMSRVEFNLHGDL